MDNPPLRYTDAGVDLAAWQSTKKRIAQSVRSTFTSGVAEGFGHFGSMFRLPGLKEYSDPVLVSSVDGVGTKLKIAFETGVHDTVGMDIVNHCIDDILVHGARPLFFLDYIATGALEPRVVEQIVEGMARACREAGIALIGGETAEMPDFYRKGEYDVAGTIVGIADGPSIISGRTIAPGDRIIGLRSSGLHTNGYSLARKIVTERAGMKYSRVFEPEGIPIGEVLLRPHRSYLAVFDILHENLVTGCAHITGGGFQENIDRILPAGCDARIDTTTWTPDPVFAFLQKEGNVEADEMYRTFNMGIGFVMTARPGHVDRILHHPAAAAFSPLVIGTIEPGSGKVRMDY